MTATYRKPTVTSLGTVQDLTLNVKEFTGTPDGVFLKVGKSLIPLAS